MYLRFIKCRKLKPGALYSAVRQYASTGTFDITVPLNFWSGDRVRIKDASNTERVYEPATGSLKFNN